MKNGSRSRTRTYDRAINSRLLYQLSYPGSGSAYSGGARAGKPRPAYTVAPCPSDGVGQNHCLPWRWGACLAGTAAQKLSISRAIRRSAPKPTIARSIIPSRSSRTGMWRRSAALEARQGNPVAGRRDCAGRRCVRRPYAHARPLPGKLTPDGRSAPTPDRRAGYSASVRRSYPPAAPRCRTPWSSPASRSRLIQYLSRALSPCQPR
jgi:hypothetical protein